VNNFEPNGLIADRADPNPSYARIKPVNDQALHRLRFAQLGIIFLIWFDFPKQPAYRRTLWSRSNHYRPSASISAARPASSAMPSAEIRARNA
jgi:hypothetical protein